MANQPELSFEEHLSALEALTAQLKEELPLEQALDLYEQGVRHAAACQQLLQQAQRRIEVLQQDGQILPYDAPAAETDEA